MWTDTVTTYLYIQMLPSNQITLTIPYFQALNFSKGPKQAEEKLPENVAFKY